MRPAWPTQSTVLRDGANLVITDASEQFAGAPAGGTLSNNNQTLTIPLASITGSLVLDLGGGDDVLTVGVLRRQSDSHRAA